EANGGSHYRVTNQNVWVNGGISRGVLPGRPERAVWYFDYTSSTADQLTIYVDALTGQIITGVDSKHQPGEIPQNYALNQNHPNPFNPETVIDYQLPRTSEVELSIFNLQGQRVATLVREYRTAGYHKITWNGTDQAGQPVASGVYLYQLKAGSFVAMKKMLLLR
ncbi:MAG: T9SS type A sorting domain-containing protein, partial [candidate division KSB1 bacterium]|nr:T9SS type A sorting domain-containing protein [candidate division KSB1 bacterium]